ncbi:UNVERIFIED_ORG: hypothetical protein M2435_005030 [Rhizobium sophorae]|nr:hypothetical protein [Rhizobium leguminosarum]MBP2490975.1 hypothetical protein [Rhizobium leguminosarum]MDH6662107.1 hypothetical protein [Rhizobium sophorae]
MRVDALRGTDSVELAVDPGGVCQLVKRARLRDEVS